MFAPVSYTWRWGDGLAGRTWDWLEGERLLVRGVLQAAFSGLEKSVYLFLEITELQFHSGLQSIRSSQKYFSFLLQGGHFLLILTFQHSLGQGSCLSLTSWKPTHCWTKKWVTVRGSALWLESCFCTWVKSKPLKCWNSSCMTWAFASSTDLTWCLYRWVADLHKECVTLSPEILAGALF